jgi:hypothetical protein
MSVIWDWIRRILKIGILEFLSRIGWKAVVGLLMALAVCLALIVALSIVIIILIF